MTEIKIFKIGDCDWIAAENIEDAKQCLFNMIEDKGKFTPEWEKNYVDGEEYELSENDLDRLIINIDPEENPKKTLTFREFLKQLQNEGEKFPSHFATSEW